MFGPYFSNIYSFLFNYIHIYKLIRKEYIIFKNSIKEAINQYKESNEKIEGILLGLGVVQEVNKATIENLELSSKNVYQVFLNQKKMFTEDK